MCQEPLGMPRRCHRKEQYLRRGWMEKSGGGRLFRHAKIEASPLIAQVQDRNLAWQAVTSTCF